MGLVFAFNEKSSLPCALGKLCLATSGGIFSALAGSAPKNVLSNRAAWSEVLGEDDGSE
jgi:hypothetical protein